MINKTRTSVRAITAMITGHESFRAHLAKLGVNVESVLCRYCGEEEETGWHVLSGCAAIWRERLDCLQFAVGPDTIEQISELNPSAVQKFCTAIKMGY